MPSSKPLYFSVEKTSSTTADEHRDFISNLPFFDPTPPSEWWSDRVVQITLKDKVKSKSRSDLSWTNPEFKFHLSNLLRFTKNICIVVYKSSEEKNPEALIKYCADLSNSHRLVALVDVSNLKYEKPVAIPADVIKLTQDHENIYAFSCTNNKREVTGTFIEIAHRYLTSAQNLDPARLEDPDEYSTLDIREGLRFQPVYSEAHSYYSTWKPPWQEVKNPEEPAAEATNKPR